MHHLSHYRSDRGEREGRGERGEREREKSRSRDRVAEERYRDDTRHSRPPRNKSPTPTENTLERNRYEDRGYRSNDRERDRERERRDEHRSRH